MLRQTASNFSSMTNTTRQRKIRLPGLDRIFSGFKFLSFHARFRPERRQSVWIENRILGRVSLLFLGLWIFVLAHQYSLLTERWRIEHFYSSVSVCSENLIQNWMPSQINHTIVANTNFMHWP